MANRNALTNDRGFSLIEVMIAIGILGVVATGISSMMTFYGGRVTEIRSEQELRMEIGTLLKAFTSTESCNRHLKQEIGTYPATLSGLDYYFKEIEFLGGKIKPGQPLPGHPLSLLRQVRLHIEGIPIPGQMVARGRIQVDYQRRKLNQPYTPIRNRSESIYLALDPAGKVINCIDERSYKQIELTQQICQRMGGDWGSHFKCDMTGSLLAKRASCKALGLQFSGAVCVPL